MNSLLAVRLSRRALGAVALEDDHVVFADSRHLTSNQDRARRNADRYLARIVDQIRPARLAVYVPDQAKALTATLVMQVRQMADASGLPLRIVTKTQLLSAFGVRPLRQRHELQGLIEEFWPGLADMSNQLKPYLADAAATAWYADALIALTDGS